MKAVNFEALREYAPGLDSRFPIAQSAVAAALTFSLSGNACALLRGWAASRRPVFFDFGNSVLWRLYPRRALVSPVMKTEFLNAYLKSLPLKGIDESVGVAQIPATTGFHKYMAREPRRRF